MPRILIILSIGLLISACNKNNSNTSNSIPEMMQPNWTGVDIKNLPVKFGHILKFENESLPLTAIVLDYTEDEGGHWFGVAFIDQNQIFGRQIPNGIINTTCLDLIDLTYIRKDALNNYKIIEKINVIRNTIGIGARSTATNFTEIKRNYDWGIEQRKRKRIPCDEGITDLNPVRECYFDLEKIKN